MTNVGKRINAQGEREVIVGTVGDANPDFRMGFYNEIAWKNFNLSSLVDWSQGATIINLTRLLFDDGGNTKDWDQNVGMETMEVAPGVVDTLKLGGDTEFPMGLRRLLRFAILKDSRPYMEDGSYIKLRELSVGYRLPDSFVQRWFGSGVSSVRLSASGRNLLTFTDYTGLDPEVSNFGNQPIARNIDVAPFPPSRSFWFSIDVAF